MADDKWSEEIIVKGTVGEDTPKAQALTGNKTLYQIKVDAPFADDDATLKVYRNSTVASAAFFSGYMRSRDANGVIEFPRGRYCATTAIVEVEGGSGDMIVSYRYD